MTRFAQTYHDVRFTQGEQPKRQRNGKGQKGRNSGRACENCGRPTSCRKPFCARKSCILKNPYAKRVRQALMAWQRRQEKKRLKQTGALVP